MEIDALRAAIPVLADAESIQEEPSSWSALTRAASNYGRRVRVSFFANLRFGRIGAPQLDDEGHVSMASLDDLLGHKLKVLLQRVEAKDYRDIAAILKSGRSLQTGLSAALALFPNLPPGDAIKALVYFEGGDLCDVPNDDRATLIAHASNAGRIEPLPIVSKRLASAE